MISQVTESKKMEVEVCYFHDDGAAEKWNLPEECARTSHFGSSLLSTNKS